MARGSSIGYWNRMHILGEKQTKKKKPTTFEGIYDELMETSKSFRESTPRSREIRIKKIQTRRLNKLKNVM